MQSQTKFSKSVDFSNQNFYNGIDVHKKQWTVTIRLDGTYIKTCTMAPSPQVLDKHLRTNYPNGNYFSVYEAGFCGTAYHTALCDLGIKNIIINPADLPVTNKLKTNRTDFHDSRALAEYLEAGTLKAIHIFSVDHQEFRSLCRLRSTKRKDTTRCKNRIKGMLMYFGITIPEQYEAKKCWSKRFVNWLKEQHLTTTAGTKCLQYLIEDLQYHRAQLLFVLRSIKEMIIQRFKKSWDLLLSIPGIGPVNAITLLSEIGDIKRFPSEAHFASFFGLLPSQSSSDETIIVNGINPRCNQYLRTMLIEAAWVAMRCSPSLLVYYKKHAGNNNGKKAIVKVARKLAMIIRGVWLSEKPFEQGYQSCKKDSGKIPLPV